MKLTQTSGDVSMTLECDAAELALLVGGAQLPGEPVPPAPTVEPFYFKVTKGDPQPHRDGHTLFFVSYSFPGCFYSSAPIDGDWAWSWAFFLPDPPPYDQ